MRLKEKISIITGAASGFGKGIAEKFSKEGSKLILVDINKDLLENNEKLKILNVKNRFRNLKRYASFVRRTRII